MQYIITKDVSNKIAFNVMNFDNLKAICNKIKNIWNKINQKVIYSIF